MADVHDKATRSFNMSQIRSKHTRPELIVRRFLFSKGLRYRLHDKSLPGKPDIVLKKYKTIVDVRGCFWHGHKDCWNGSKIKSNSPIIKNRVKPAIERDKRNEKKWKELGWNVVVVWDTCELEVKKTNSEKRERILRKLLKKILQNSDTSN